MSNCPCGSNKSYRECCHMYITNRIKPETPEKLMRSRYTAYTKANMDYIQRTMKGPALKHFNAKRTKKWAGSVEWLGLQIINSTVNEMKGYVEFIAHYNECGKRDCIHEISEFQQLNGQWYYINGEHKPSIYHK